MPNIGPGELIIILVIALIVLGPGKLPDVAQSLGKSVREFRRAASDLQDATKLEPGAPASPTATSAPAAPTVPAANTLNEASEPNSLAAKTAPTPASTSDTDAPAS
jgi:sec-independent protein translocase protein TatA